MQEGDIMHGQKHCRQNFARIDQVPQIRFGVIFATIAITFGVERRQILFLRSVSDHYFSPWRQRRAVPCNAGGKHAVEHIDPPKRTFDEAVRRAYAH